MEITSISTLNSVSNSAMPAVSTNAVVRPPGQNANQSNTDTTSGVDTDGPDFSQYPSLEVVTRRIMKAMHEAMKKAEALAVENAANARKELARKQNAQMIDKQLQPKLLGQSQPPVSTDSARPADQPINSASTGNTIQDAAKPVTSPLPSSTALLNTISSMPAATGKDLLADAKFSLSQVQPSDLQVVHQFDAPVDLSA